MKVIKIKTDYGYISAYEDDVITKEIIQFGNHTRPEYAFATHTLEKGQKAFDLGSHIGSFMLKLRSIVGDTGEILCVEGSDITYEILCNNIKDLRYKNVKSANYLISEKLTDEYFFPSVGRSGNRGANKAVPGKGNVPIITLDKLTEYFFEPEYIKMDIEGFETMVLMSSEYIKDKKPTLYFEYTLSRSKSDEGFKLNKYLLNLGYKFYFNDGLRYAATDKFNSKRVDNLYDITTRHGILFDVLCVQ